MPQTFIIISDESINKTQIFKNITNFQILPKMNTKIPIYIKFGSNYSKNYTKIYYKTKEYIIKNNNDIQYNIDSIIKSLVNDIYFDKITIELYYNKNIEYYDLPSYKSDYIDSKLISLYEKYLELDNIKIINIVNNLTSNNFNELINNKENDTILINLDNNDYDIQNIDLTKYKKYFHINNNDYYEVKDYFENIIFNKKVNINYILNNLYLDLDNYQELLKATYEEFYNHIYISNKYRHHNYYKINNNIINISLTTYEESKIIYNSNNYELLEEYKDYEDLINKSIEIFDEVFDYYIKKLEPNILKYFVIIYYNSKDYIEEFESDKDYEFIMMLKGLRKMCISDVKNKLKKLKLI
jgi:hypothetical protein